MGAADAVGSALLFSFSGSKVVQDENFVGVQTTCGVKAIGLSRAVWSGSSSHKRTDI
jgi:hypothetical protein